MDSGNSSSLQSSSGGDEEYDSRAESSLPAFLNTSSSHFTNPHPSLPTFFDPSSSYFNPFSQPNNSVVNLDGVRPRGLRSDNQPGSSGSNQSLLGAPQQQQQQGGGLNHGSGSFPSSSRPDINGARSLTQSHEQQITTTGGVVKNPKKRTRASRRAPTTVLTTDTTNFRAMVQEFTGIPAPPFSGSSYSRRLDLFGSGSGMRSTHLEPLGSLYPLRPSAKRIQPSPFLSSSNNSPSLLNNNINPLADSANITNPNSNTTSSNAFNPNSSSNFQLPSDLGLLKQTQNMLNLQTQSPVLSFQSFLQPPPTLHPSLNNLPGFGVKSSQGSSAMASLDIDELGISHGGHVNANLGGLQSHHVTADGPRLRSESSNWRDGVGLNDGNDNLDVNYGNDHHHNSQRVTTNNNSCKLNYSASSSDFHHHHDKGLENVSSRAEGTVDSWICPAE
ncbi:VQ motif-containing protein [Corchorus olitorius]|uniref:VQ motif-containing protein n=1 Tax=Corchorus olitorius TaxID=93759 RepID=A0A1R3JHJ0_9ROSI|nr:VQ motif-containing protein [Corchorus olitorius]